VLEPWTFKPERPDIELCGAKEAHVDTAGPSFEEIRDLLKRLDQEVQGARKHSRYQAGKPRAESLELVTGFTSFFFASDMVAALREARRVAKPGAPVVIQVWGAHERCDLEAMKEIARPFFPPRPPEAPPDPDLSVPGALEAIAVDAGLTPTKSFDASWAYEYPDSDTLARALVAPAGLAVLVGVDREDEVRAAIVEGLAPNRLADGSYRLENEYHYLIAHA